MRSAIVVLWLLGFAASAAADDPRIQGLQVALEGDRVLASFVLQDAFDRRTLRRALLSGAKVFAVRQDDVPGGNGVAAMVRFPL